MAKKKKAAAPKRKMATRAKKPTATALKKKLGDQAFAAIRARVAELDPSVTSPDEIAETVRREFPFVGVGMVYFFTPHGK